MNYEFMWSEKYKVHIGLQQDRIHENDNHDVEYQRTLFARISKQDNAYTSNYNFLSCDKMAGTKLYHFLRSNTMILT